MLITSVLLNGFVNLVIRLFRRIFSHSGAGFSSIVGFVGDPAAAAINFVPDVFATAISAVYHTVFMCLLRYDGLSLNRIGAV